MIFAEPLPFREAIESRAVRQLLPTDFRTKLLQEIPAELRERAVFSAGVTNVPFLQEVKDSLDELVEGKTDRATKRAGMKKVLSRFEYRPVEGEEGTLTDLSSDRRLNLILDVNLKQAQGYGHWRQGQEVLDAFPAQELIRVRDAEKPRNWAERWSQAGGEFFDGRMIALKNDPIWTRISAFGLPYPPFDFGSGMDVQDIDRSEAEDLGLIAPEAELLPQSRDFNADLQASPEVRDAALKEALVESLGGLGRFIGGILRFVGDSIATANSRHYERDELGRFASDGGSLSVDDNIRRGGNAVDKLRREKGGTVEVALQVAGLGDVEIPWGRAGHSAPNTEGKTHTDGYGLSHIIAKHGDGAADALPEVLAKGRIGRHSRDPSKRQITHGKWQAIVGKTKKPSAWVITNFAPLADK